MSVLLRSFTKRREEKHGEAVLLLSCQGETTRLLFEEGDFFKPASWGPVVLTTAELGRLEGLLERLSESSEASFKPLIRFNITLLLVLVKRECRMR